MFQHNNYTGNKDQGLPSNYTFDLKVNVDFHSGHVNVKVPNHPFAKKQQVPMLSLQHQQSIPLTYHQQISIPHHQPINQPMNHPYSHQNIAFNQTFSQPFLHRQQQNSHSSSIHHQAHTKGRISLNTTTFLAEQKPQPVQCVICQKFITQQNFLSHLQQHRNRKQYENNSKDNNSSNGIHSSSGVSIRNKNQSAEYVDYVKNSRFQSQSHLSNQQIQLNISRSNASNSYHQSNYPSNQVQNYPVQYAHQPFNHSRQERPCESQFHLSQSSNSSHSSHSQNYHLRSHPQSINSQNFTLSGNGNRQRILQNNLITQRQGFNNLKFNKIESMILRRGQSNRQLDLENFGESMISRNSVQSQTANSELQHIKNGLKDNYHNDSMTSQNSEESLRAYASSQVYKTVQRSVGDTISKKVNRSTYTDKPLKSKLPTNYLAVQQFLSNSTSASNYRLQSEK